MHRIPDLAEHFLYFNDDVYLMKPSRPEDFFRGGLPCDTAVMGVIKNNDTANFMPYIMLNMMALVNMSFDKRSVIRQNFGKWFYPGYGKGLLYNLYLLPWGDFTGFRNYHSCVSFCKSTLEEVWDRFPEVLDATCRHKFRDRADVNQYLFRYWQLASGRFAPKKPDSTYLTIGKQSESEVERLLRGGKYRWSASTTTPWTSISIRSGSSWWISSSGPSRRLPPLSGHEPLPKLRERTDAMKKLSRAKNTMRNTLWGAIYRVATLIGRLPSRPLHQGLGQEYNGLSTLFTSVLTVLNLANLGFNSSLVFTMYKAIAEDDKPALCAMLKFYRKVYRIVGLVILGMGLAVMPFLPWLVKNDCPPDMNLYVLFAIYLSESVLDYLMFAYNNATFTAFQRNDVTLKISTVRYVVQYTLQAAVLLIFSNYYAYIILLPLMVIPNNVAVYLAARKHYPDIVCQGELDPVTKKDIYKRVGTLFGHKLGNTFLVSIDSIIISSFLGLTALSLYSNYYYILTAVNGLVEIVTNGSLSGIGNKLLTDSREDNYRFFKTMTYGWVALVGGAAACMLCFYQPFIAAVWLGPEYLLDERLMMLIVLYFFSWMFRIMQLTYRDAAGLWTEDWLKPYVGMAVNLVGSIWMVKATGSIAGVLVPTILVFFFIYTPWEAWVVVKYQFYRSWNEYMGKLLGYVLLAFAACAACYGAWPVAVTGQYHPVTAAEVCHRGRYLPRHLAGRHRTHGGVEAAVGHSAALFAQGEKGRIIYTK